MALRKSFLIFLFTLSAAFCGAQNIPWTGANKSVDISQSVMVLEDPRGIITIDQVTQDSVLKKFVPSGKKVLNFGITDSWHWVKFSVFNNSNEKLILEVAQAFLPYCDLYFKNQKGEWKHYSGGYKVTLNSKIIKHHFQVFPLDNNVHDYYLHLISKVQPVPVIIWKEKAFEIHANNQLLYYGIYSGILIFVIINNIFWFFSFRKWIYLHYASMVFIYLSIAATVLDGFILYLVPNLDLVKWYIYLPILSMANSMLYAIFFLEIKKYVPKIYKASLVMFFYFLSYNVWSHFLPYTTAALINELNALIVLFTIFYLGVRAGNRKNKIGYFFAAAYFIYFAIVVVEILYIQTGAPTYLFEVSHVSVAIFVEALLLSFTLSKKFEWEEAAMAKAHTAAQHQLVSATLENERMVREQNDMLERKVNERTLELRETQQQLVQKEKLASLGELTAGIAHEIKNPLNFINNFTDITREMFDEMMSASSDEERAELNTNIRDNLEKISRHGKRADEIVDGMLLHSRAGGGEKEMTDINFLCEEAISLSYPIMKSSFPGFECVFEKSFVAGIPKINIIREDVSRVLVNLLNNSMYAAKQKHGSAKISFSTAMNNKFVFITIRDNGGGIPDHIRDKIFQPFFTTKPAGEGTGLGLSISFDIIKSNGGDIKFKSIEGDGTEFVISLPVE